MCEEVRSGLKKICESGARYVQAQFYIAKVCHKYSTADRFKVEVGLHQGSTLSPFLFALVMDRLTDEVRQESP